MKKILIIDDEPEFYAGLVEKLRENKFSVQLVDNLEDGAKCLSTENYNLILVDLFFERTLQGLDFIQKTDVRNGKTPIVIVSIEDGGNTVKKALKTERVADYLFKKEYDIAKWIEQISKYCEKTKVFISYSWADKNFVWRFAEELERQGFQVLIDKEAIEGGDNLPKGIVKLLKEAHFYLLMLSKASVGSQYVPKEISYIVTQLKRLDSIIPIYIEDKKSFELPEDMSFWFSDIVYYDFSKTLAQINKKIEEVKLEAENSWTVSTDLNAYVGEQLAKLPKGIKKLYPA